MPTTSTTKPKTIAQTAAQAAASWSTAAKNVGSAVGGLFSSTAKQVQSTVGSLPKTILNTANFAGSLLGGSSSSGTKKKSSGGSSGGGSSKNSTNTVNFNSNTGQALKTGESFIDNATGQRFTQGDIFSPSTYMSNLGAGTPTITNKDVTTPYNPVPSYTDSTDYNSILGGISAGTLTNADALQAINDTAGKEQSSLFQSMIESIGTPPSSAEAYKKAQKQTDILAKQQKVSDLTSQLNSITAQGQANQLAVVGLGRGIPEGIIGGQQAQFARETAIQSLPVAAQLSAAQGNLELAQQNLDTLFKLYSDDATNQYNYKKEVVKAVYDFATKQQQNKLDLALKLEDRAYQERKASLADAKDYAKMAFENGQSALGSQIMSLDIKSSTYRNDLSQLLSQIKSPTLALDVALKNAQLAKLQKETSLLGEPTAADRKALLEAKTSAKAGIPILEDKIAAVDILSNHPALSNRVGTSVFTRKADESNLSDIIVRGFPLIGLPSNLQDIYYDTTGQGQDFAGGVHKLTSKEFLDALIDAKARGATFGSLTEREGDAIRASATAINDWEIKNDKGIGIGIWNIDEQSFKRELDNIKRVAQRSILNYQGTIINEDEQSMLDGVYNNMEADPALYY